MEVLATLSLAGNLVQFTDFTYKLVHGTRSLYHSHSDSLEDSQDLEALTKGLQEICAALFDNNSTTSIGTATSKYYQASLHKLAKDCEAAAGELLKALNKLKAKDPTSKWSCFRAALATTWKESRINAMQTKLEAYRSQLLLQLQAMIRETSDESRSDILDFLDTLSSKSRHLQTDLGAQIGSLKTDLHGSLRDLKQELVALKNTSPTSLAAPTDTTRSPRVDALTRSKANGRDIAVVLHLLESLSFEQMNSRQSAIHEAHANTLQWVFTNKFYTWAQSSGSIFWISGKPGSGKSTLMKWLLVNDQTARALHHWADSQKLVIASYFFWCHGTDLQRSQEGFLRALLYDILCHRSDIIATVLPDDWERAKSDFAIGKGSIHEWTRPRLEAIFKRLSALESTRTKFCFFVDGLDEFFGDHDDLIDTLRHLIGPGIKLCVASRPLNVFEHEFGQNLENKIYMQDVNTNDIQLYIKDKLLKRSDFKSLQTKIAEVTKISDEIVQKSQGVFLWVFLVVRSLIDGLRNYDRVSQLRERLHHFPSDLKEYFQYIFDSLDPIYKKISAHMFQVALASHTPLHPLIYWFLDELEDDPDMAVSVPAEALKQEELDSRMYEVRIRINGRCKGLLEVLRSNADEDAVYFLHRTVKDWLKSAEMQTFLLSRQQNDFNAHLTICKASLAVLNSIWPLPDLGDIQRFHVLQNFYAAVRVCDNMEISVVPYIDVLQRAVVEYIRSNPIKLGPVQWCELWLSWLDQAERK